MYIGLLLRLHSTNLGILSTPRQGIMSAHSVKDKHGMTIKEGDFVLTKYRGGTHQGKVSKSALPGESFQILGMRNKHHVHIILHRWKKSSLTR